MKSRSEDPPGPSSQSCPLGSQSTAHESQSSSTIQPDPGPTRARVQACGALQRSPAQWSSGPKHFTKSRTTVELLRTTRPKTAFRFRGWRQGGRIQSGAAVCCTGRCLSSALYPVPPQLCVRNEGSTSQTGMPAAPARCRVRCSVCVPVRPVRSPLTHLSLISDLSVWPVRTETSDYFCGTILVSSQWH